MLGKPQHSGSTHCCVWPFFSVVLQAFGAAPSRVLGVGFKGLSNVSEAYKVAGMMDVFALSEASV